MGYRKDLMAKPVESIDHNIEVADSKFTFKTKVDLIFEETMDMTSYHNFSVKDLNGMEYFRCGYNRDDIVVYSIYNEPICRIAFTSPFKSKQPILKGEKNEESVAVISDKDSSAAEKFTVELTNLVNEKTEKLDMNCDLKFRCCGIFYGKEKSGSPMVCRIVKNLYFANYYKIEIAAGIDASLMMALTCFFMKKSMKENKGKYPEVPSKQFFDSIQWKPVERPLNNIPIVDSKYISEQPQVFTIKKEKKAFAENFCKILGTDGKIKYKVDEKSFKTILYDVSTDEAILNISETTDSDIKRKIWSSKKREKCFGQISAMYSRVLNKYSIQLLNKDTNIYEKFIMNCDPFFYYCDILYLNGNGQVSLVCKVVKDQYEKFDYQIEIAPGVDSMMMIAASIYFIDKGYTLFFEGLENMNSNDKITAGDVKNTLGLVNKVLFSK